MQMKWSLSWNQGLENPYGLFKYYWELEQSQGGLEWMPGIDSQRGCDARKKFGRSKANAEVMRRIHSTMVDIPRDGTLGCMGNYMSKVDTMWIPMRANLVKPSANWVSRLCKNNVCIAEGNLEKVSYQSGNSAAVWYNPLRQGSPICQHWVEF